MRSPSGLPDVAEPVHVFVLDHLVDDLPAVRVEPSERGYRNLISPALVGAKPEA